ncbi:MAG TPA: flagellar hook-basal body complex protein FliE [Spirochaetia bacterium]|nr:flagellar hook-basal body complex protein FliE [Spirochaetia bacterium]
MNISPLDYSQGHQVNLIKQDPKHFGVEAPELKNQDFISEFGGDFSKFLRNVSDLEVNADSLVQKMIVKPNSVNIHEVTIASQKAELSLSFTKAILNKVVDAYKNLTQMR